MSEPDSVDDVIRDEPGVPGMSAWDSLAWQGKRLSLVWDDAIFSESQNVDPRRRVGTMWVGSTRACTADGPLMAVMLPLVVEAARFRHPTTTGASLVEGLPPGVDVSTRDTRSTPASGSPDRQSRPEPGSSGDDGDDRDPGSIPRSWPYT
jgi:hypothetical protein